MPLVNEGIKMKLLYCVIYYIVLGVFSFLLGRILPKGWFNSRAFPYKPLDFEAGLYKKLRVKQWQNTLPDMSRILPKLTQATVTTSTPKKMTADYGSRLPRMLQETCVAEFIHVLLSILGFGAVFIVGGAWGWIISIVYFLAGNLPYIIIQRYNRPRLLRLEDGMKKQEGLRQK